MRNRINSPKYLTSGNNFMKGWNLKKWTAFGYLRTTDWHFLNSRMRQIIWRKVRILSLRSRLPIINIKENISWPPWNRGWWLLTNIAHVRILYENYLRQQRERTGSHQKVLFPEVVQLSASESVMLKKILPEMAEIGFELTDLGGESYAINSVPSGLDGVNAASLFRIWWHRL